jgi:predicted aspartyl protease
VAQFPLDRKQHLIFCEALIRKGRKEVRLNLALDTGASYTMISSDASLDIGINPAKSKRQIDVTTGSGVILTPVVSVPIFRSLGQEVRNLEVICHDLPSEGIVDGLLGLNFLKHFNVHLKFLDGTMDVVAE